MNTIILIIISAYGYYVIKSSSRHMKHYIGAVALAFIFQISSAIHCFIRSKDGTRESEAYYFSNPFQVETELSCCGFNVVRNASYLVSCYNNTIDNQHLKPFCLEVLETKWTNSLTALGVGLALALIFHVMAMFSTMICVICEDKLEKIPDAYAGIKAI